MVKEPTEEQSKILQQKGNIVITAKPGSGKTYTIVEKIARVIPDLPEYKGVIAISFTNKASDELKRRCKQRCADTKQSFFGTILCSNLDDLPMSNYHPNQNMEEKTLPKILMDHLS